MQGTLQKEVTELATNEIGAAIERHHGFKFGNHVKRNKGERKKQRDD